MRHFHNFGPWLVIKVGEKDHLPDKEFIQESRFPPCGSSNVTVVKRTESDQGQGRRGRSSSERCGARRFGNGRKKEQEQGSKL